MHAANTNLKLQYEGSVKRVFAPHASSERLWFEFTDDYSVFDWGKMPETIAKKGRALTVLGAVFFMRLSQPEFWQKLSGSKNFSGLDPQWLAALWSSPLYSQLSQHGLNSHYHQLNGVNEQPLSLKEAARSQSPVYMNVMKADVHHPQPAVVLGQTVFHYSPVPSQSVRRLVPLEVVFRFGMPAGSSLKERLEKNPAYATALGLKTLPSEGSWFPHPVLEFFTKLEPKDRLLTLSEAMLISGLSLPQFEDMAGIAQLVALALFDLFAASGIELWDGKFEFILDNDQILIADSIGPDELRLIYKGLHLSKEIIRQVYRGSQWEQALKRSQKLAVDRHVHDWKSICKNELNSTPENLPANFKAAIDHLYPVLANCVAGEALFENEPDLDGLVAKLNAAR